MRTSNETFRSSVYKNATVWTIKIECQCTCTNQDNVWVHNGSRWKVAHLCRTSAATTRFFPHMLISWSHQWLDAGRNKGISTWWEFFVSRLRREEFSVITTWKLVPTSILPWNGWKRINNLTPSGNLYTITKEVDKITLSANSITKMEVNVTR